MLSEGSHPSDHHSSFWLLLPWEASKLVWLSICDAHLHSILMEAEEDSEGSGSYPGTPRDSNEEIKGWGNNGLGSRGLAASTRSQSSDSYSSDDSDSDSSSQRTSGDYMSPITELSLKNNHNIKRDEVKRRVEPVKAREPLPENKFKSAYEEVYVYEAENEDEGHTTGGGFGSYLAFDSDQKDSSAPSTPLVSQYVDTEGKKGAADEDSQEVLHPSLITSL